MEMTDVLRSLGVHEEMLTLEERRRIDEDGYLLFPGALAPDQVEALAARLEELAETEKEEAGQEVYQEPGAIRISNLVNKAPLFDVLYTHPLVLAGVHHVLGSFKVSSVDCRFALPGHGHQKLHQDWQDWRRRYAPPREGNYYSCSVLWLLDEFTEANGATRLVPGSHRSGRRPDEEMPDRTAAHPDEIRVVAPAGAALFYNSHLWHGGTLNQTARPRRAAASSFVRRDHPQLTDQRKFLRPETQARLSEEQIFLLDV